MLLNIDLDGNVHTDRSALFDLHQLTLHRLCIYTRRVTLLNIIIHHNQRVFSIFEPFESFKRDILTHFTSHAMEGLLDSYSIDEPTNLSGQPTVQDVPDLGVDEEVVVRTRRTIAKLDETKFLGPQGISKLKGSVIPHIKFKGKGHERRDLTKLLGAYQLWAHRLFPKANFEDFIQMAKKAGSSRTMRMYRRQWIDEERGAPKFPGATESNDRGKERTDQSKEDNNGQSGSSIYHVSPKENTTERDRTGPANNELLFGDYSDDDDDDGLYNFGDRLPAEDDNIPDENELEQLRLQEQELAKETNDSQNIPNDDEITQLEHQAEQPANIEDHDPERAAMEAAMELGF